MLDIKQQRNESDWWQPHFVPGNRKWIEYINWVILLFIKYKAITRYTQIIQIQLASKGEKSEQKKIQETNIIWYLASVVHVRYGWHSRDPIIHSCAMKDDFIPRVTMDGCMAWNPTKSAFSSYAWSQSSQPTLAVALIPNIL